MKRGETYTDGFLKAKDLLDQNKPNGLDLTIKGIRTSKEMDDGNVQRCISFAEDERELGLNATNWDNIADMLKVDDDEKFVGHVFNFYPHKLDRAYNGKTHGIRVRAAIGVGPAKAGAQAPPFTPNAAPSAPPPPAAGGPPPAVPPPAHLAPVVYNKNLAWNDWVAVAAGKPVDVAQWNRAVIDVGPNESAFTPAQWEAVAKKAIPF